MQTQEKMSACKCIKVAVDFQLKYMIAGWQQALECLQPKSPVCLNFTPKDAIIFQGAYFKWTIEPAKS